MLNIRTNCVKDLLELIKNPIKDVHESAIETLSHNVVVYNLIKSFTKEQLESLRDDKKNRYLLWDKNLESGNYIFLSAFLEQGAFLDNLSLEDKTLVSLGNNYPDFSSCCLRNLYSNLKRNRVTNNNISEKFGLVPSILQDDKEVYHKYMFVHNFMKECEKTASKIKSNNVYENLAEMLTYFFQELYPIYHKEINNYVAYNFSFSHIFKENNIEFIALQALRNANLVKDSDLLNTKLEQLIYMSDFIITDSANNKFFVGSEDLNNFEYLNKHGYVFNTSQLLENKKNVLEFILKYANSESIPILISCVKNYPEDDKPLLYYDHLLEEHKNAANYLEIKQAYRVILESRLHKTLEDKGNKTLRLKV